MNIETIELLDNGIIQLDSSYIELKLIGGILVQNNSDNVRIELKNSKTINLIMSKELSTKLASLWLQEIERKNNEAIRCSKPKEGKKLSDDIAEKVIEQLGKLSQEEKKELLNSQTN